MKLNKYQSKKNFLEQAIQTIESTIIDAIEKRSVARIALSGGNSPKPVYRQLSQSAKIDWKRVEIYLVDERYVPTNSDESNAKMIRKTLIDQISGARFFPFATDQSIDKAARNYEEKLRLTASNPLFDLVILGLGTDGHTASLFPGIPELDEAEKWVVNTTAKDYPTEDRLSLTFPAILNSRKIIFLIQGNKDEVVQRWLEEEGDFHQLPVKKILEHHQVEGCYLNE